MIFLISPYAYVKDRTLHKMVKPVFGSRWCERNRVFSVKLKYIAY